jgi:hypothetical protein
VVSGEPTAREGLRVGPEPSIIAPLSPPRDDHASLHRPRHLHPRRLRAPAPQGLARHRSQLTHAEDRLQGTPLRRRGDESWELDALEPATLQALITGAIERHRDEALWEEKVAEEDAARERMEEASDRWSEVEKFLAKPKGKRK